MFELGASLSSRSFRPVDLGSTSTDIHVAPEAFQPMFVAQRAFELSGLIRPSLLANLVDRCQNGIFIENNVEGLGTREIESTYHVSRILDLALSRAAFLRWIEAVTGCSDLIGVSGGVVQARSNAVDALDWHDDLVEPARRLAITINLSEHSFAGGEFEMHDAVTRETLAVHRHQEPGTALIFDVARDVEHRVLPVTSGGPRRVYTGWFMSDDQHRS